MPRHRPKLRSLLAATDMDVLPDTSIVEDHGEYIVVRSPENPSFHWGSFLLWRDVPSSGCRRRWEAAFEEQIRSRQPTSSHIAFAWDTGDGEVGAAESEFVEAGYELETDVALTIAPEQLRMHPRANSGVVTRDLDPEPGADSATWDAVVEQGVAEREPGHTEAAYRRFLRERMEGRRQRFRNGDGAWLVAEIDGSASLCAGGRPHPVRASTPHSTRSPREPESWRGGRWNAGGQTQRLIARLTAPLRCDRSRRRDRASHHA